LLAILTLKKVVRAGDADGWEGRSERKEGFERQVLLASSKCYRLGASEEYQRAADGGKDEKLWSNALAIELSTSWIRAGSSVGRKKEGRGGGVSSPASSLPLALSPPTQPAD